MVLFFFRSLTWQWFVRFDSNNLFLVEQDFLSDYYNSWFHFVKFSIARNTSIKSIIKHPLLPLLNSQLMNFSIFVVHVVQLVISVLNHSPYISIDDTIEFELNNKNHFPDQSSIEIFLLPITTFFLINRFAATTADLFFWKSSLFHVVWNSLTSIISSENEEDIHIRFYIA